MARSPSTPSIPRDEEAYDALLEEVLASPHLSPVERAMLARMHGRDETEPAPAADPATVPPLPDGPFRFFALDVETANHDRGSICQVGVACVRPDNQIETWVTLINPRTSHWVFSGLHGITGAMVAEAPSFDAVLATLEQRLEGHVIYQHSGFDRSAFRAACQTMGRPEPAWNWQNSVSVARRAWPELKGNGGHGLASLKTHLGLQFEHHDAGEDARAAAEVVLHAEAVFRA